MALGLPLGSPHGFSSCLPSSDQSVKELLQFSHMEGETKYKCTIHNNESLVTVCIYIFCLDEQMVIYKSSASVGE